MSKSIWLAFVFIFILFSCASINKIAKPRQIEKYFAQPFYNDQFTGFKLFDPSSKKTIKSINANKYFIPASNTKIITLFTALKTLKDSVVGLKYLKQVDTLYIKGTGDPSLLHPYFKDSTVIRFLKNSSVPIVLQTGHYSDLPYGPGWAWEDFDTYFSPEKSGLPIYGNVLNIWSSGEFLNVAPREFFNNITFKKSAFRRKQHKNQFYSNYLNKDSIEIPFITSDSLTAKLLSNTIEKPINFRKEIKEGKYESLLTVKTDSLLSRMMIESDNFVAEQILLLASDALTDTLNSYKVREHILNTYSNLFKDRPRWVDGSGLSRYNLFSPNQMVTVLDELYQTVNHNRLFDLFPKNGVNGTLKKYQKGDQPFLFAKSGSMGNTYNLSGYLKTNSGLILLYLGARPPKLVGLNHLHSLSM